jgi:hypothetical protein
MKILHSMADQGLLDSSIVKDLDNVLAEYSGKDTPPPSKPTGSNI